MPHILAMDIMTSRRQPSGHRPPHGYVLRRVTGCPAQSCFTRWAVIAAAARFNLRGKLADQDATRQEPHEPTKLDELVPTPRAFSFLPPSPSPGAMYRTAHRLPVLMRVGGQWR